MKKHSLFLIAIVLMAIAVSSCKKYEDGPFFSLASKKGRVAGDWTLESATVTWNGASVDATAEIKEDIFAKIEFDKEGTYVATKEDGGTNSGTWEFDDKKEKIIVTGEDVVLEWEILRLKSKELWLKGSAEFFTDEPDSEVEFHFEQ